MNTLKQFTLLFAALLLLHLPAQAQRGTGQAEGLARQGVQPEMVFVAGTVSDLLINPCELTTGRSVAGAHVILQDHARGELNIHLGPATDLSELVSHLQKGDAFEATVFRTPRLAEGQFIARDLNVDGEHFVLRDDNLRPVWAGQQGVPGGRRGDGRGMRSPRGWRRSN